MLRRALALAAVLPFILYGLRRPQLTARAAGANQEQYAAQSNPAAGSAPQAVAPQPIRITTRMVQVSVVVQDKHGNPITGLTKSDFSILDDKQLQEIQFFSINTNEPPQSSPKPLPPNTYTNTKQDQRAPQSITVILLDGLNTPFLDQTYARMQVIKYLDQIKPQDRVAIYTLGHSLRMLHDFTTDSASLVETLQRYKGGLTSDLKESKEWEDNPVGAFLMKRDSLHASDRAMQNRVQTTVEAFRSIANHVGSLPGRKNLIWVSGSFPLVVGLGTRDVADGEPLSFGTKINELTRVLNDANLAVYPVDARGLIGFDLSGPGGFNTASSGFKPVSNPDSILTMKTLAAMTGGRAYFNTNDIKGSIHEAIDDSKLTYELAYSPASIAWDGKYHTIRVRVKQPGANVRARAGYFALPEPQMTPALRQAVIALTAMSALDATTLGLTVRVLGKDPKTNQLRIAVFFDAYQLYMCNVNKLWTGALDTVFIQVDDRGEIVNAMDQTIRLNLTDETFHRMLRQGINFVKDIPIVPNAIELRVVFRDATTGNFGSVGVPLETYFLPRKTAD